MMNHFITKLLYGALVLSPLGVAAQEFQPEPALNDGVTYRIGHLKTEQRAIEVEIRSVRYHLVQQSRELSMMRSVAAGKNIKLEDRLLVPQAVPGAAVFLTSLGVNAYVRRSSAARIIAQAGTRSVADLASRVVAIMGASWSMFELVDRQGYVMQLGLMSLEELHAFHEQKAEEYNRNLQIYNQLQAARQDIINQIAVIRSQN